MSWTNLIDLIRQVKNKLPMANGGVPAGGTTGQVLTKASNADNDVDWEAASSATGTVTHTGGALTAHRVVVGNGTDDVEVIAALGSAGQYLRSGGAGVDPAFATPTPTEVGLSAVTNDAQTKAAIVPNTAPSAGQVLAGNGGGTAYAPVSVSGAITLSSAGVATLAAQPYSYHLFVSGRPTAAQLLIQDIPEVAITFPASLTGSTANIGTNPAATATYTFYKNGSSFGTLAISTGGVLTWTSAAGASFNGTTDVFKVVAPTSQDTTLADVGIVLKATR